VVHMSSGYAALVAAQYLGHSAKHADTTLFAIHGPADVRACRPWELPFCGLACVSG